MKKILSLFLLTNLVYSQEIDENKYLAVTKTVYIESKVFNKQRELQIYLPDEYFKKPDKKFKTIFLFDAQNQRIFNYVKGNVELLSMNYIEPVIIIGIVTEDRWFEFLPKNNHTETLIEYEPPIGGADILIKHIKEEVQPFLKDNYRILDSKIGIGHSLGGTFLLYFNLIDPYFFNSNILLSPNFSYDDEQMFERIKKFDNDKINRKMEFYIYSGYGDNYENKFNKSLFKINKWLKINKKYFFNWKYEKLNINDHGKIWLEGVYKGLLRINKSQNLKKNELQN